MTAEELVEQLKEFPPDANVVMCVLASIVPIDAVYYNGEDNEVQLSDP